MSNKIRPKRASTWIDMTAMSDVNFLILTFFIMTATFKSKDVAQIEPPTSISSIKVPEEDIMVISFDKNGSVFFGIDNQNVRIAMLDRVAEARGIQFTDKEKKAFSLMPSFGIPMSQLKPMLNLKPEEIGAVKQPGIPMDSTGADSKNELKDWIYNARMANNNLRIAVKGDNYASFPSFKNVMATLQAQNINKFNLITGAESAPAGWSQENE